MSKVYTNSYPELKQLAYQKTTVTNAQVLAYMNTTKYTNEQKASAMVMFRYESRNGEAGVNNNYCGIQADGNRYNAKFTKWFTGVVYKKDGSGTNRWFIAFDTWQHCIDMLLDRIAARGVHVGGYAYLYAKTTIDSVLTLAKAYKQEWVLGTTNVGALEQSFVNDFTSMYNKAYSYFESNSKKKINSVLSYIYSSSDGVRFFILGR